VAAAARGRCRQPCRRRARGRRAGAGQLFFDRRLSASGELACASCHDPKQGFQDGRRFARHGRNTPGLLDAAERRWFGWDGAKDSLWAASLAPLLAADEIAATPAALRALFERDAALGRRYRALFGAPVADETLAVNVAKALAAYQATLRSRRTAFDDFRDALLRGDSAAASRYPAAAQRGLKLFLGAGRCFLCHAGPAFTNGEFADIGRPFFTAGGADPGRWGGLQALQASPFSRLGAYSDAGAGDARATSTRHVVMEPRHFGEFKVPGLRGLAATAPYFHDGSAATVEDVVRHYSELDESRLHADGERILRALRLSPAQVADLAAFLRSLSAEAAAGRPRVRRRVATARARGRTRWPRRPGPGCGSVRCRTAARGWTARIRPAGGRPGR
jgi:cytochrome c peroxidase